MKDLLGSGLYRSKKIMKSAKDCPRCMHCNKANDGTIVGAHYTGHYQQVAGKGMGIKSSDAYVAYLCSECHEGFDQYKSTSSRSAIESFLLAVVKSHEWLLKEGIIK